MRTAIRLLAIAIVSSVLFSCSGPASNPAPPVPGNSTISNKLKPNIPFPHFIYVADFTQKELLVYPASDTGNPAPIRTISLGGNPQGVATDQEGQVYVGRGSNTVDIFSSGGTSLIGTISATTPRGITVDTSDNLYIADLDPLGVSAVSVFAHGSTTPFKQLHAVDNVLINAVAVDPAGDVFMDALNPYGFGATIQEIPAGSSTPTVIGYPAGPSGIAVQPSGKLAVGSLAEVLSYTPPNPAFTILQNYGSGYDVHFLSTGPNGNLNVPINDPSTGGGKVWVYPAGITPPYTITQGLQYPVGVAAGV